MREKQHTVEQRNNKKEQTKKIIRGLDSTMNFMVLCILLILCAYASFILWDTNQLYRAADSSKYKTYKPIKNDTLSFVELKEINPEVAGWITVFGTKIDYPIVQGENNDKYVNTDAMGTYSLSGSIFMDYRNDRYFKDYNTIVYGHHMVKSAMFGDIEKFENLKFFNTHRYGRIFYNNEENGIEFFAYLECDAYDSNIYAPNITEIEKIKEYYNYIMKQALHKRDISVEPYEHIILLSTCASDITNGRQILVGKISNKIYKDSFEGRQDEKIENITEVSVQKFLKAHYLWVCVFVILICVIVRITYSKWKNHSGL